MKELLAVCPQITVIRGDIRTDRTSLSAAVQSVDYVLHLAAQVAVTTSVTDPRTDFEINAFGTFNVLEAIRLSENKPGLIFASTNKVYGGLEHRAVVEQAERYAFTEITGVSETEPLDFHSPYGCSKGAADQYVRDYSRMYNLKTVVMRQSCIYGPQQFGIEDQGWVAWFIIAGMFGRPVTVYGNGKQVRDLLFVDDLVQAYDLAFNRLDTVSGEIFNMGGGVNNTLSLLEFIRLLNDDCAITLNYSWGDTRPGDQPIFVSNNDKAKALLGWEPRTTVNDGIAQLINWLRTHESEVKQFYV